MLIECKAMSLNEIFAKEVSVGSKEKTQGLRGGETHTFSLVKDKSHKRDQEGVAREQPEKKTRIAWL